MRPSASSRSRVGLVRTVKPPVASAAGGGARLAGAALALRGDTDETAGAGAGGRLPGTSAIGWNGRGGGLAATAAGGTGGDDLDTGSGAGVAATASRASAGAAGAGFASSCPLSGRRSAPCSPMSLS